MSSGQWAAVAAAAILVVVLSVMWLARMNRAAGRPGRDGQARRSGDDGLLLSTLGTSAFMGDGGGKKGGGDDGPSFDGGDAGGGGDGGGGGD